MLGAAAFVFIDVPVFVEVLTLLVEVLGAAETGASVLAAGELVAGRLSKSYCGYQT